MSLKTLLPLARVLEISDETWKPYLRRRSLEEIYQVARECGVRPENLPLRFRGKNAVIRRILVAKQGESQRDWESKQKSGHYEVLDNA
jgi:hypothetical protein